MRHSNCPLSLRLHTFCPLCAGGQTSQGQFGQGQFGQGQFKQNQGSQGQFNQWGSSFNQNQGSQFGQGGQSSVITGSAVSGKQPSFELFEISRFEMLFSPGKGSDFGRLTENRASLEKLRRTC